MNSFTLSTLAAAACLLAATLGAQASPVVQPNIVQNLVIATGQGTSGNNFAAFRMSNTEIGANQEVLSTSSNGAPSQRTGSLPSGSSPNLYDVFKERWTNADPNHGSDTVGRVDTMPGARPLFEGIDYSGNVALTGSLAKFESSNSDVNASIGIQCNRSPSGCFQNPSSPNSYFSGPAGAEQNLNALNGVSQFDPNALIGDLSSLRNWVVGQTAESVLTTGFVNRNRKDSTAVYTDLDALDINGDGWAVIDIDVDGNKFELNNTDWVLNSSRGTRALFRMADGTHYDFSNSSIMLGDGQTGSLNVIDELGAIFYQDAFRGNNQLFNLNNVVLGGIGLYDLTDFNPNTGRLLNPQASSLSAAIGDFTQINLQNSQGCAQFISHEVVMSNNRWNLCPATAAVPTPATLPLAGLALAALALVGTPTARRPVST